MKTFKKVMVSRDEVDTLTCDRCKCVAPDWPERQNFTEIYCDFGYGSEYFGDRTGIIVDLCEKCVHELFHDIGEIIDYTDERYY